VGWAEIEAKSSGAGDLLCLECRSHGESRTSPPSSRPRPTTGRESACEPHESDANLQTDTERSQAGQVALRREAVQSTHTFVTRLRKRPNPRTHPSTSPLSLPGRLSVAETPCLCSDSRLTGNLPPETAPQGLFSLPLFGDTGRHEPCRQIPPSPALPRLVRWESCLRAPGRPLSVSRHQYFRGFRPRTRIWKI